MKKILLFTSILGLLAAGCSFGSQITPTPTSVPGPSPSVTITVTPQPTGNQPATNSAKLFEPISNALSRVTKKPFGIYITPATSPVQPEKFKGYHTGTDFETTPAEQAADVKIYAACDGKLLLKKFATGYGGVAVQSCSLNGQAVTIIYGHLRLSSITPNIGDTLTAGQQIAVLGTGYSSETNGERKHLHFGIHKGSSTNILGYVQVKSDLDNWMDAMQYLK